MGDANLFYLIGAITAICSLGFGYIGYRKGCDEENYKEGSNNGSLVTDTQYIKRRIDDVLLEQKDTNKSINALAERVTRVEESAKQAHKRIDRFGEVRSVHGDND